MKKLISTTLLPLVLLTGVLTEARAASAKTKYVVNTSVINLVNESSEMNFGISYPGRRLSGLCGVEIRLYSLSSPVASPAAQLLSRISLESEGHLPAVAIVNSRTLALDYKFVDGLTFYGVWFTIKTKNGESLQSAIESAVGPSGSAILIGKICQ